MTALSNTLAVDTSALDIKVTAKSVHSVPEPSDAALAKLVEFFLDGIYDKKIEEKIPCYFSICSGLSFAESMECDQALESGQKASFSLASSKVEMATNLLQEAEGIDFNVLFPYQDRLQFIVDIIEEAGGEFLDDELAIAQSMASMAEALGECSIEVAVQAWSPE